MLEHNEPWDSKFALRSIKYERSVISNICDSELVGREVRNGEHIISLSREYFLEALIDESEAKNILPCSGLRLFYSPGNVPARSLNRSEFPPASAQASSGFGSPAMRACLGSTA